ncbi:hypothetical protein [Basfia succiniciproducens]|uniref:hypothetical protein n=1 Tax=Basfia succiniciproducens TaxID=653940 RepID=UPI0008B88959|nr:hypothetical protein [Basfia succiniciproducens]SEP87171.1 hypothetical protein SAMN02910415_00552 [Basfia succiniciproducens]
METNSYEMIKQIIVNDQLGKPKNLKVVVVENSLSDRDKERIKQAVLDNAGKGLGLTPEELAESLIKAIKIIELS